MSPAYVKSVLPIVSDVLNQLTATLGGDGRIPNFHNIKIKYGIIGKSHAKPAHRYSLRRMGWHRRGGYGNRGRTAFP